MKNLTFFYLAIFGLMTFNTLKGQPLNDDIGFATVIPHADGWTSSNAAYTTSGATADGNAGTCWNTSPNYNVWFRFQATGPVARITVKRGGVYGTIARINAAIWLSNGTTQVACKIYVNDYDDVIIQTLGLVTGSWYYLSVDNNYSGYRGTFSLSMNKTVDYDYYEGAIEIPHTDGWESANAAYTTIGATPDRSPGTCWNTSPNYNRWFKFQATGSVAKITVRRGGVYGTIARINSAIWQADGTTQVACKIYVNDYDNVIIQTLSLVPGNWYYLSIDNNYSGYRGTFSLLMETAVDYDYYEGAIEIPHTDGWESANAAYTTIGATPDRSPGTCWNTSPNYNRWFKFQATGSIAKITVRRGGVYGTIARINSAIWQADGTTQVACKTYINDYDNVIIQTLSLVPGNWYYLSIDNNYSGYRGTFSLLMETAVDYDYYEGAIEIPHTDGWESANAAYTTIGATPDRSPGTCWNTSPNYNRWFKFQATGSVAKITVRRGGVYGTIARINSAIWQADGTTQVACKIYVNDYDNVIIQTLSLVPGNWYYLSIDNNYSGYRGTFSLLMETAVDYDYYEGAIEIPHTDGWESANAAYTTIGATPDRSPGTCWNTSPNYNRWFKFQATGSIAKITVRRGGVYGTIARINSAIWQADGTTQVACKTYINDYDNVIIQTLSLVPGNWYYLSIDNNYSGYRGTFSLLMETAVDYDYYEGAIEIPHTDGWESANAAYTTIGATPDRSPGTCWNTSPNYNRWFKFQATGSVAKIIVRRGGVYGTIARINSAIWLADGTTQVACKTYINDYDNVIIQTLSLVPGNWYYLSIDNNYSGYRGTFSLLMETAVDYDYYEGAFEITDISNWCSTNAQFSTIGATPDKNPGSCWNTSPNYNRWFKFQASGTGKVSISILRGGSYGNILGINAALWQANGTTQVACSRYNSVYDNIVIQKSGLTVGNWYYLSVDNYYSGYRGTFSICIDDGSLNWNGIVSSDWNNPLNWDSGSVPDQFTDVSIPGGVPHFPIITGHLTVGESYSVEVCRTISIDNGASVTVNGYGQISIHNTVKVNNGGTLTVGGIVVGTGGQLFILGGTVTASDYSVFSWATGGYMTAGSLILNSTDFVETNWYASGGTIYFDTPSNNDVIFDVTGTLNIYDVQVTEDTKVVYSGTTNAAGNFTILPNGKFDLSSGSLNVAGNTYFEADASGMGQFIDHGTMNVTGTSTVEQYLTSQRWHFVSPPIDDAQIGVYYHIYLKEFNEPTNDWTFLVLPLTIPMNVTQGYTAWPDNYYTGTTTVSYEGDLNPGSDYPVPALSYTPSSPGAGWNLLGNPYSAPLQWNSSWSKANLSEWACIHNNGHDECYNATTQIGWPNAGDMANGIIPSTQGFWVRATSASASVTIPQSQRTFSDQAFYKDAAVTVNESIRLKIEGNNDYDAVLIQFIPGATEGFDPQFDLEKRWGYDEAPQLWAITADLEYFSVNALPELTDDRVIPLGFKVGLEDSYVITAVELENFTNGMTVVLEDIKTNTFTELSLNADYRFDASPIDEQHRFNLHFKSSAFDANQSDGDLIKIYSSENIVYIQTPELSAADIVIYDITGREITRVKTNGDTITRITLNSGTGYYLVRVQTNDQFSTRKVFIK